MGNSAKKTTQEFLSEIKSKDVWDENYDYSMLEYVGATKKVLIIDKRYNSKHLIQSTHIICNFTIQ